jgi:hypothetical protein
MMTEDSLPASLWKVGGLPADITAEGWGALGIRPSDGEHPKPSRDSIPKNPQTIQGFDSKEPPNQQRTDRRERWPV